MSRIKLLLDVVKDLRSLADSVQAVADALEGNAPSADASASTPVTPPDPQPALEEVRAVLGQKSRAGYTDAVRGLLQQFGATKLSEVKQKDYAALMKAAEELDHGA